MGFLSTMIYIKQKKLKKIDKLSIIIFFILVSIIILSSFISRASPNATFYPSYEGYFYWDDPMDQDGDGEFYIPSQSVPNANAYSTYYILVQNPSGSTATFDTTVNITLQSVSQTNPRNLSNDIEDFKIYCMFVSNLVGEMQNVVDPIPNSTISSFVETNNWGIIHKNESLNGVQSVVYNITNTTIECGFNFDTVIIDQPRNYAFHFLIWVKLNDSAFDEGFAGWQPLNEINVEISDDIADQSGIHFSNIFYGQSAIGLTQLALNTLGWMLFFTFVFIVGWIVVLLFSYMTQKGVIVSRITLIFFVMAIILFFYFLAIEYDTTYYAWAYGTAWMCSPFNPLCPIRGVILLFVQIMIIVIVSLFWIVIIAIPLALLWMASGQFKEMLDIKQKVGGG
jgi:hypothetical protein